jgi:hypothetical protein
MQLWLWYGLFSYPVITGFDEGRGALGSQPIRDRIPQLLKTSENI